MKKSVLRVAAAAAVAGLFATMAPLSAFAAATPAYDSTTDAPIYLMNNDTAAAFTPGTQMGWTPASPVVLSSAPIPADLTDVSALAFPSPPAGVVNFVPFISLPGSERTKSAWKSWGNPFPLGGSGVLLPAVYPSNLGNGAPAAVKAAGGTYSMGIAYMSTGDLNVVKAYYTTINVDAGGTWTFSTPVAPPTTVPTTTNLSADKTSLTVGGSVMLTATVTPSAAAGSVEFFDGTTSLGMSMLSTGTASKSVVATLVRSHSYTATFTASTSAYGASTSSVVTVTTVAKKFTTTTTPTISGTAKVGKKLTAKVKAWNPVATFAYQWYANGTAITGAIKSTWKLAKSQKGKKITVKVTGSRADYASLSLTSKATAKVKK
jgi:hypothetical protein